MLPGSALFTVHSWISLSVGTATSRQWPIDSYLPQKAFTYLSKTSALEPWITGRPIWGWLLQIKRQETGEIGVEDGIQNYDYDNINDRENFCPALGVSQWLEISSH